MNKPDGTINFVQIPGLLRYWIGRNGVVYRDDPALGGHWLDHPMKAHPNDEGYPRLRLTCDDGKRRSFIVHILVARAFLPPPAEGQRYVLHNDRCRTNASADNLRWGTHQDNHDDKVKHGTVPKNVRKLTPRDVRAIRRSPFGAARIAKKRGLSVSHVREIRNGRKWRRAR